MQQRYPHLFSPYRNSRGFTFKNRLMASPIGIWSFIPANGVGLYALEHFEEKARGGCSVVTMGDTPVDAAERAGMGNQLDLRSPNAPRAFLSEFAAAIGQHGAFASIQLNHSGLGNGTGMEGTEEKPKTVAEVSDEEMALVIRQFAESAAVLKQCGFQMCMLHFGHGKFIDQWLDPAENLRSDLHGGSVENRIRFPAAIVRAVREAVGEHFMIELRMTGTSPETEPERFQTHVALVNAVQDQIDLVHVSSHGAGFESFLYSFPCYLQPECLNVSYAAAMKRCVKVPVVAVGGVNSAAQAEEILASGQADFVAMGRALIADPELPRKSQRGQEADIRPCIGCHNCLMQMHAIGYFGCDINPRAGRGSRIPESYTAPQPRRVVIIGGGPAGMQCAITASDAGHSVLLLEKAETLGGILCAFDHDPVKYRMRRYKEYLIRQLEKRPITVRLQTEATPEMVENEHPDVVVAAVGSSHIIPQIPGVDGGNVYTAMQAHALLDQLGSRVAVIGGNLVGCETALSLLESGRQPTIVEMTGRLHADLDVPVSLILDRALENGVQALTNARCTAIAQDGITAQTQDGERFVPADSVVLAAGMRSNCDLAEQFRSCAPEFYNIGDSLAVGTVRNCSRSGFMTARDL